MKIGVLALQGSIEEHISMLKKCSVETLRVKFPCDLNDIDGLIIPGGESTTLGKLLKINNLDKEIIKKAEKGMVIYGTCAGAILLAKNIVGKKLPTLRLMDISVKRNDYGRQIDSFETDLGVIGLEGSFRGVFIRAPVIDNFHNGAKVLSEFRNKPVLVQQNNLLVSTFHPELTDDDRIHKYFLGMVEEKSI